MNRFTKDADDAARFRAFQVLWREYRSILNEPTFTMEKADREQNQVRLEQVYRNLTALAEG